MSNKCLIACRRNWCLRLIQPWNFVHGHGSYRQFLFEMGSTLNASIIDPAKTQQVRLGHKSSGSVSMCWITRCWNECLGLLCNAFVLGWGLKLSRASTVSYGEFDKTRFLGSSWVSKMPPCMHAVNPRLSDLQRSGSQSYFEFAGNNIQLHF